MHLHLNKKILFYIIFLFLFGSINNINLRSINFLKIKNFEFSGLDNFNYLNFKKKIIDTNSKNIFFLQKNDIKKIVDKYNMIENIYVFKKYPSTLRIEIKNTKFLANTLNDGKFFLIGSNGKLIESKEINEDLPKVFGKFSYENFFKIKQEIDQSSINYEDIKNLFFFPSKRWDIEFKDGLLLRLPTQNVDLALKNSFQVLNSKNFKNIKSIDLRILNQIIINE